MNYDYHNQRQGSIMTMRSGGKRVIQYMRRMRKQDPARLDRFVKMVIQFGLKRDPVAEERNLTDHLTSLGTLG